MVQTGQLQLLPWSKTIEDIPDLRRIRVEVTESCKRHILADQADTMPPQRRKGQNQVEWLRVYLPDA